MTNEELKKRLDKHPATAKVKIYDKELKQWVSVNVVRFHLGEILLCNVGGVKV